MGSQESFSIEIYYHSNLELKILSLSKMKSSTFFILTMLVSLITPRCFATYLLVDLEANIQRVKTTALRFQNGEVNTLGVLSDMIDSTKTLTDTLEEAGKATIDPSMKKIQDLLNGIADDFLGEQDQDQRVKKLIEESYLDLSKTKMTMRRLKDYLNAHADETINQVERITKTIDDLTEDTSPQVIEFDFQTLVRLFIAFLDISKERLQSAQAKYKEAEENLMEVETRLNTYKNTLVTYLKNENNELDEFVDKIRSETYPVATLCVLPPMIMGCPIIFIATAIGVEVTINNARSTLENQKSKANKALEAVKLSNVEINKAYEFMDRENPLILKWSARLNAVSTEVHTADNIMRAIKFGRHIRFKNALVSLKVAAEKYLKNDPGVTSRMYE